MQIVKHLIALHWLKLFLAIALLIPFASNAACGLMDKKVSFVDGSSACLNEFSFLNVKGLMKSIPNESYSSKSKSHSSYAIAVTAEPMLCPFEQSMQWDWNGDDGRRAVSSCESKMTTAIQAFGKSASVQSCKCEILIDNGKTKFSRTEFDQRTKQYERQIALGLKPIQVVEAQMKEQADREAEAKRHAEAKKREDDRLIAMKERAEREEAERKKNAPPIVFASRKALLIGNDTYKYAEPLKNAREDARAMAAELKSFGYEVTLRLDQSQKEMQAIGW